MIEAARTMTPAQRQAFVDRFVGHPYTPPSTDCYGIVQWFLDELGYQLPWGETRPHPEQPINLLEAATIHPALTRVEAPEWGDILVFAPTDRTRHGSLALYVDDGRILTASAKMGSVVVRLARLPHPVGVFRVSEEVRRHV